MAARLQARPLDPGPRQAAGSARGRAALDALLKDMENMERRVAQGPPFDFSRLRRELGLD